MKTRFFTIIILLLISRVFYAQCPEIESIETNDAITPGCENGFVTIWFTKCIENLNVSIEPYHNVTKGCGFGGTKSYITAALHPGVYTLIASTPDCPEGTSVNFTVNGPDPLLIAEITEMIIPESYCSNDGFIAINYAFGAGGCFLPQAKITTASGEVFTPTLIDGHDFKFYLLPGMAPGSTWEVKAVSNGVEVFFTGAIPEEFNVTDNRMFFFDDQDGDGAGDPAIKILSCNAPDGFVDNNHENCPDAFNPDQFNSDLDSEGDVCDIDDDNDGVNDEADAFILDPNEWVDTDNDGIGNNADQDDDNDTVEDAKDVFPLDPSETVDSDHDGFGNNSDPDDDNDTDEDVLDCKPLDASINHFALEIMNDIDDNCDGIIDPCDAPSGLSVSNISAHSAKLTWSSVPSAKKYEIRYRSIGSPVWKVKYKNALNTPTNSLNITDLTSGSNYQWRVRTLCSIEDKSTFSYMAIFTTNTAKMVGSINEDGSNLNMFPNPASDMITIQLSNFGSSDLTANINIYDMTGKLVKSNSSEIINGEMVKTVETKDLTAGLYLVQIIAGSNEFTDRLVITK